MEPYKTLPDLQQYNKAPLTVVECMDCGALVRNKITHSGWHLNIERGIYPVQDDHDHTNG